MCLKSVYGEVSVPLCPSVEENSHCGDKRQHQQESDDDPDRREDAEVFEGWYGVEDVGEESDDCGDRGQEQGDANRGHRTCHRTVDILPLTDLLPIPRCEMN